MIVDFLKRLFSFDSNSQLLFTQFDFWALFAIVFTFFSLLKSKVLLRNSFIFFVSLFFYYKTSGWAILILVSATLLNFAVGIAMNKRKSDTGRVVCLLLGLVINLGVLCYFKYAYLFSDMVNDLFGVRIPIVNVFAEIGNCIAGKDTFTVDKIILPVGISFYTFQCISYIMDVFRQKIEPVTNIMNFGFYVTFFPQLVAGPIIRAADFVPQIYKPYFLSRRQFGIAVFWILNGLAKKLILSDYLAVNFVDRVFENPLLYTGFENLVALFAYSLQVYADFSGYTDIAIGVAMVMGFHLPKNFNSPYKATNPGEFWKRWHISLSKWLQDYLYIPLGGNRNASIGTYACILTIALIGTILSGSVLVAIIVVSLALVVTIYCRKSQDKKKELTSNMNRLNTMLLGGLWHGASWNFMIWGGLNGIGMIVYRFWKDWDHPMRLLVISALTFGCYEMTTYFPAPIWNIALVWSGAIWIGTFLRFMYNFIGFTNPLPWLERSWAILQTFVFITWTRLFFRAGSNLDPAEANEVAWNTAKNMVTQIGGAWNIPQIPEIASGCMNILLLFCAGMIIHWIPERTKRYYRICFSSLPLPIMAVVVVIVIFVLSQFVTADLQKFIYYQF